jgi:hypothetical protein
LFRRTRIGPDLERLLGRFLELQIAELEDRRRAAEAARRAELVRSQVGRTITHLVLLLAYAVALGIVTWSLILGALLDPRSLSEHVQRAAAIGRQAVAAVPNALLGLTISTLTTLVLLVGRGASFSLRMDLGGALFVGGAVLSLVGIAAAAYAGPLGVVAAVVGYTAALLVVHEFCDLVLRLRPAPSNGPPPRTAAQKVVALLQRASDAVQPRRHAWLSVVFVAVPTLCVLTTVAAGFTQGGPLFVPARIALFAFVGWSVWACAVTPTAIRIPLWSILPWALLVLTLFGFAPVSIILGLASLLMLLGNVLVFTLRVADSSSLG